MPTPWLAHARRAARRPLQRRQAGGERRALATGARLGVPVTVVQPTVVYGPRATVHASEILEEMRTGRLVLVNGGTGTCNAVHVDDVATALLLAAVTPSAAGERLLVSGPEHPTWADFFGAFERMLGRSATVTLTEAEALELWRRSTRPRSLVAEGLRVLREEQPVRARLLSTREVDLARAAALRLAPRLARAAKARLQGSAATVTTTAGEPVRDPSDLSDVAPSRPWLVEYLAKRAAVRTDRAQELSATGPPSTSPPGCTSPSSGPAGPGCWTDAADGRGPHLKRCGPRLLRCARGGS